MGGGARWSGGHAVASISRVGGGIVAATRRPTLFEFLMMHLSRADLALLSRNFHGPEEREVLDRFAVIALINYRAIDTGTEGAGEINFIVPSPSRRPCPSFVHYNRRSKKSRRSHEVVRSYARTMTDDGSMRARARTFATPIKKIDTRATRQRAGFLRAKFLLYAAIMIDSKPA